MGEECNIPIWCQTIKPKKKISVSGYKNTKKILVLGYKIKEKISVSGYKNTKKISVSGYKIEKKILVSGDFPVYLHQKQVYVGKNIQAQDLQQT